MSESTAFPDFIRRIRAGDDQAARELVERYEPVIRCEVRLRLRDPRLYSRFDWTDICQSVMASFFVRAAAGQYDLEQPDQLLRLLVVMTRHKLANQARRHRAEMRDCRRLAACDPAYLDVRTAAPSPSRLVVGRELLAEVNRRLSEEERLLADLRARWLRVDRDRRQARRHRRGTPQATGPRGRSRRAAAQGERDRR